MLSEVIWKKHGVILKIKPIADLSGRMSIDIETEVSMVQPRSRAEGLPSLSTNRIKTHFDLEGSRTVALSGLLKSVEGRGRSGLPILSELPILGPLFSSRDYLEERTELVFFVTPKLVPFDSSNKSSPHPALPDWKHHDS
jgi:pilus assembly protein CpaC